MISCNNKTHVAWQTAYMVEDLSIIVTVKMMFQFDLLFIVPYPLILISNLNF